MRACSPFATCLSSWNMASIKDPLAQKVDALIEEYSAPEVIEALVTVAAHHRKRLQKTQPGEAQGWKVIEAHLGDALIKIGG